MEERMALMRDDPAVDLTVDGNAVGGLLAAIFGADVTSGHGQCATCDTVSMVATLRAYARGPGIVLRCPACAAVVIRIVQLPSGVRIDLQGAAYMDLPTI